MRKALATSWSLGDGNTFSHSRWPCHRRFAVGCGGDGKVAWVLRFAQDDKSCSRWGPVTFVTTVSLPARRKPDYCKTMSSSRFLLSVFAALMIATVASAQNKKEPPPPPAHAKAPSPAVTDEFIHQQFGENCSLIAGPPQFVADLDDDGIEDLVVAAKCKNPMADKDE